MTYSNISIAGEAIPLAALPDIKIEQRKAEITYRVTVTVDVAFSSAIIAACGMRATITISIGNANFTGVVTGFGCRAGYSIVQIDHAVLIVSEIPERLLILNDPLDNQQIIWAYEVHGVSVNIDPNEGNIYIFIRWYSQSWHDVWWLYNLNRVGDFWYNTIYFGRDPTQYPNDSGQYQLVAFVSPEPLTNVNYTEIPSNAVIVSNTVTITRL